MSLPGTIIKLPDGGFAIECKSTLYNEAKTVRHVWRLVTYRTAGMSWRGNDDAIGKPATLRYGKISCYLAEYFAETAARG